MEDRDIEARLREAVERTAPDGKERLLSEIRNGKGAVESMKKSGNYVNVNERQAKKRRVWPAVLAACLLLAILGGVGGGFYYRDNVAVATVVSLDVNPSIELRVNRAEKVLECSPLNDEAVEVLSSMDGGKDLVGAKLDVAVNAIVGAIVRAGYLDSLDSAILISVEDKDADRGARLQAELVATVDGVLQNASNGANVMSQNMTLDAGLTDKAQKSSISTGKAALVEQVLAINPSLEFEELAKLTVEELRDLIRIGAPGMPIGKAQALSAAEEYAGVLSADCLSTEVDPEIDDATPHYEVEFTGHHSSTGKIECKVDAFTGEVISCTGLGTDLSHHDDGHHSEPAVTSEAALDCALSHHSAEYPELGGYNTFNHKCEYDYDDGWYDVEFWCNGYEFDYDVDASTGAIIREETRYRAPAATQPETQSDPQPAPQPEPEPQPEPTPQPQTDPTPAVTDIGTDAAKAAALKDAGVSEGDVTFIKAQKDRDDGRTVYDVEFYTVDTEHDYEIDAATGAVVKHETELRPGTVTPTPQPQPDPAPQPQTDPTPAVTDIGTDAAKAAALKDAGVSESDVTFIKAQKDYDDGRTVYDVEFYTVDTEHDYEIDAATGAVVKHETEARPGTVTPTPQPQPQPEPTVTDIGLEAAKEAALARAGVAAGNATWIKSEHDWDDGHHRYELEFECGSTVYECEVNAADGAVVSFSSEKCDNELHHHDDGAHDDGHHGSTGQTGDIGAEAAKSAALSHAGLSENQVMRLKCERDYDDGRLVYEVEFKSNGYEYEYKIDAASGSVLDHEKDRDD